MAEGNAVVQMETFFMALADKTRLRLLNLMRDEEVCVCFFTEVLGDSQPKISRHLAYLRNAGMVSARRDGKWVHYSVAWPEEAGARKVMEALFDWCDQQSEMARDRERYREVCCSPESLVQIARTPITFIDPQPAEAPQRASGSRSYNELEEFLL